MPCCCSTVKSRSMDCSQVCILSPRRSLQIKFAPISKIVPDRWSWRVAGQLFITYEHVSFIVQQFHDQLLLVYDHHQWWLQLTTKFNSIALLHIWQVAPESMIKLSQRCLALTDNAWQTTIPALSLPELLLSPHFTSTVLVQQFHDQQLPMYDLHPKVTSSETLRLWSSTNSITLLYIWQVAPESMIQQTFGIDRQCMANYHPCTLAIWTAAVSSQVH